MSQLFDRNVFPDRPWNGRGYGRIRLDEPLAKDLAGIMYDVVSERLTAYHQLKDEGIDPIAAKLSLKRASQIRQRVVNLIHEQGWDAEVAAVHDPESDIR